ncbi:oxygen-independent coproporphyrinogen-3 oxidase [Desulfonispora thiosulfatigenes DSM 11270]|uniref:Heme chaperone HemW n=1 Tax=Desulfonispora thiosulfatigenes DSM 11270 TaxID=656914 RepID=A0A1W1VCT9_DESTI|nr:radical SAM family heme chaperone HemW [Desulfonispora thiosulfatigenes]SMB90861.1 oxygen-independent coproporphyrinogen-3 oxidase [Desulfonispora thiosulfatigenes DSM 11270]
MAKSLYIHIPFCESKCNYCDFLSYPSCDNEIKTRYVKALEKEITLTNNKSSTPLKSVFFGGGTPTSLSGSSFCTLMDTIKKNYYVNQQTEITTEANPETVDYTKLCMLKDSGINRVSFGVQTFDEELLKSIGRIHSAKTVYKSYGTARKAGFLNVNLDLMYGLPEQSLKKWEHTLLETLALEPEHISLYQLKIEETTPLGKELQKGKIEIFDDEIALEMYKMARAYLGEKGYKQYEISNFAKPGYECKHNKTYWLNEPYIGIGLGACSYKSPTRKINVGGLEEYLENLENNQLPFYEEDIHDKKIEMSETVFMGLRLTEGVSLDQFENRFGEKLEIVFKRAINKCISLGLIELNPERIRLTDKGLYIGNLVFEEFLLK